MDNSTLIKQEKQRLQATFGLNNRLLDAPPGRPLFGTEIDDATVWHHTDLTLLKPEATEAQVAALCDRAREVGAASVCVNPLHVLTAVDAMYGKDDRVPVISVVGFPLGASLPSVVSMEAQASVSNGAAEIDMVLPVGLLKEGNYARVYEFIKAVVTAVDVPVKVILETCLLEDAEIVQASLIAAIAGAKFVKTSTGFNSGGATLEHVRLMRETIGDELGVKASGGIRTLDAARDMLRAGADRIGASNLQGDTGY